MDSTSPIIDSISSTSEDCIPTSSRTNDASNITSPSNTWLPTRETEINPHQTKRKANPRNLNLDLDEPIPRRPHFLDEDYLSGNTNLECRIPKPHFLDHSPDELDERSDITNPNFLEDDLDEYVAPNNLPVPKRQEKTPASTFLSPERNRSNYRSTLHYGLENTARSSEMDKRVSQLYRGTWPGERNIWSGADAASVRSFSSNGSNDCHRPAANLDNKMDCVCSLISLLSLSPENNADLSTPLLEMSRSPESCVAMRQAGCIPLLVQLLHSQVSRETRDRAAKALRNIIHTQTDDKAGRREARVWRLLEQVREYCYALENIAEARKQGRDLVEDEAVKHPSQSVAALMKLSFDEEHRHVVCQLGGLQTLASLVSGDQAVHGSKTDDSTCLTMRKYAGMTLTNLTFGDGNNKSLLCSFKDFMMALVEQLESPNDDMRQVTAAVLRNLSWRADTNSKQVLREVGAVKGLTRAAMTCQKEATLKSILSALWNLTAHCSMNKVALCSVDGALGFLVDMLSYDSPTKTLAIVENAGGIMRNVSSHIAVREEDRRILRERNCLSVLLQHLKSPSLTVVSNSCGTLWNLSARCPQDQQFLWDHGAVPMLRSLVHSKHKMIAMGSSAALKNLLNSKPGKSHILSFDTGARSNLPALPTLGARKQKALEQELDQNLAETCDNIEPATSPSTNIREEKNLFTATERQIAMSLERHRMTSSSPLMSALTSLGQNSQLTNYLSCNNTLLKGEKTGKTTNGGSANSVNRSDSKDSVTSAHSDSIFEKGVRVGKVPIPTPRNKGLMKDMKSDKASKAKVYSQPPVPPPRGLTDSRHNYTESYDADQDTCDQPVDYSKKYPETKVANPLNKMEMNSKKYAKKEHTFGDYQETDLDQPTNYSLRYAENHSETGSDSSEPQNPAVHEDTIKHFATEGTPYETPIIFSNATSMSDLISIGREKDKSVSNVKENSEAMTHSDEKDTCSIEEPPQHDNDKAVKSQLTSEPVQEKRGVFDTKYSSGMLSPEKPINYCDEGTPGYFSRVSSLSSLDEGKEDDLAKKNAMATINPEQYTEELQSPTTPKEKEGSKAVTFASEPEPHASRAEDAGTATPPQRFIEETPLMFSRTSSLGSLPDCDTADDQGSVQSEVSRLASGCISPSDIPDSPGAALSAPPSPPAPRDPTPPPPYAERSVFEERVSCFVVEHTPAQFSTATSLSSLTIDDEPTHSVKLAKIPPVSEESEFRLEDQQSDMKLLENELPIETTQNKDINNSDDSSSLSDAAELLEECIQRGIEGMVKRKGPSSNVSSVNQPSDTLYRSLPPHLRSSTETVRLSKEYSNRTHERSPPPLPPKSGAPPAPPRPPAPGLKYDNQESPRPQHAINNIKYDASKNDSLSSLSLDSFGSTDREIFEETVRVGMSVANGKTRNDRSKAHSLERPTEIARVGRVHKSLDRSEKISHHPREGAGKSSAYTKNRGGNKFDHDLVRLTRSPISYHGETSCQSLAYHAVSKTHNSRYQDAAGPNSLPLRIEESARPVARSNSLSSMSSGSFGSTDKEIFERCVKIGMSLVQKKRADPKVRSKSNDRLESRDNYQSRRHKNDTQKTQMGALDKMVGEEYSKDRALLEEVIARGAGDVPTNPKNVLVPFADRADAGGLENDAQNNTGSEPSALTVHAHSFEDSDMFNTLDSTHSNFGSGNNDMSESNECLAPESANTTLESDIREHTNSSNESYAEMLDGTWSESGSPLKEYEVATLTRKNKNKTEERDPDAGALRDDSSEVNLCDVNTFLEDYRLSNLSSSFHLISSIKSEVIDVNTALPDLLEKNYSVNIFTKPDLMDKLNEETVNSLRIIVRNVSESDSIYLENIPEPSFTSLVDDGDKFDSILNSEIEREAVRLAAQLKNSSIYDMQNSSSSFNSLDLDHVKPPSDLGSLLSLSASGQLNDFTSTPQKLFKNRKHSLPVSVMVKRALSNSFHQGSSEKLDSNHSNFLENVKPPSEMELIDVENTISESSILSEVADIQKPDFDLNQPISDFPLCRNAHNIINVESLDEMSKSTLEQTTEREISNYGTTEVLCQKSNGTLSSENNMFPKDGISIEPSPIRHRDSQHLTPREKRCAAKERYQTYTITQSVFENRPVTEEDVYLTWTKSVSDKSDDFTEPTSDTKIKRRLSAKQRRQEDRARYQTQTVDINSINIKPNDNFLATDTTVMTEFKNSKRNIKQKRVEEAARFRTRTLSNEIPPSPTFVIKDGNLENIETTTGYDSLSSNEPNHQVITDDDYFSKDIDSGHNDDDFESSPSHTEHMAQSYKHIYYDLPIIEGSATAIDMCIVNNLKNIEMTASYRKALQSIKNQFPSTSAVLDTYRSKTCSEDSLYCEENKLPARSKPKIIKPSSVRDQSLDSNESTDKNEDSPKSVRGRKKPAYISPYRRNTTLNKKPLATNVPKVAARSSNVLSKTVTSAKPVAAKSPYANTGPKKDSTNKYSLKTTPLKPISIPPKGAKPLPLERQGTFTKETATPMADHSKEKIPSINSTVSLDSKKSSSSRLRQPKSYDRDVNAPRCSAPSSIKNSISNHSLQSGDSVKTVTLRKGSMTSLTSAPSSKTKAVESKIASLWKKVEQSKSQPQKPDRRVWIESSKPKMIRSSTFESPSKDLTSHKPNSANATRPSQIPRIGASPKSNKAVRNPLVRPTSLYRQPNGLTRK